MNSVTRSISYFVCGAIVASLPWLLSNRATVAQGERIPPAANSVQGFPGAPAQPGPGGFGGGQFRPQGAPVSTIVFQGDFMFVGAGDTVYKIDHRGRGNEPMRIISSVRLGQNMGGPGRQPDARPRTPGAPGAPGAAGPGGNK